MPKLGNVKKVTITVQDSDGNKLKRVVHSTDEEPAIEVAKAIEGECFTGIDGAWKAPKSATNGGMVLELDEDGDFKIEVPGEEGEDGEEEGEIEVPQEEGEDGEEEGED